MTKKIAMIEYADGFKYKGNPEEEGLTEKMDWYYYENSDNMYNDVKDLDEFYDLICIVAGGEKTIKV